MNVLIATWNGGGNVNPQLALAAELDAAGHAARLHRSSSWDLDAQADDLLGVLAGDGVDVVVVDYILPAYLSAAEAAGVPAVAHVHTLWSSNVVGGELATMTMAASVDGVNALRARLGVAPVARLVELLDRCARVVVTAPRELDGDDVPPTVEHTGPVLEDAGPDAGWAPPPGDDPLVVVSLGTTPMDEGPVLQRVLDGLADRPVRVVANACDHVDAAALRLPPNAVVTRYVRHAAVLPHADAVVCHAGLGTTLAALAHGLPLLCLPLGRDQPGNAAAVARVGAGRSLDPSTATPADIAAAVETLLADDGAHRAAAQQLAGSIAATRGRTAAAVLAAAR